MMNRTIPTHLSRQRGAALLMGLILLTVLTLLSLSSMTQSTLSLRMADNVKQEDIAAQAAESALMQALTSTAPFNMDGSVLINEQVRDPLEFDYLNDGISTASTTVTTILRDKLPGSGCSLNSEFGSPDGCTYQHFQMNAIGTSGRGGTQNQNMGFYIQVPN
ncbi:MAG: PilX N-terminal domain-containing pilus assembly protein [Pseudomonadota bacterium]